MVGRMVSHYQIVEKLGEGGMGVVYKAHDTHLDRFVAIKVLPADRVADENRRRRFVQEAKAASALNHPNIVTVHDISQADDVTFIAMECVEGKTLDQLIGRKGLKLNDALRYAIQIADALAAAHTAGIVHRDLKPANIMVTGKGLIKVLDFGLAKLTEPAQSDEFGPTQTMTAHTEEGTIVGTVAYMSPEQAEGKIVDARSDIFSFGSVLYEMLTGRRAFSGDSKISTLAAIVHEEPKPLEGAPAELEKLLARCLKKDPARRFQHMDDAKVQLEEMKEESDSGRFHGSSAPEPRRSRRRLRVAAVAAAALLLSAAVVVWRLQEGTPPGGLKAVVLTSYPGSEQYPSLSPDGNKVAFSWNGEKEDNFDIYVKRIGATGPPMRLTTDPARETHPAWSPDDRWIAFNRWQQGNNVAIMLISPLGGPERKLTEVAGTPHLSWTPDAKWLAFGARDSLQGSISIWAIEVETGDRRRLTTFVTQSAGSDVPLGDYSPSISPDGSALAFARQGMRSVFDLYVQRLTRDLRPKGDPARITHRSYPYVTGIAWTANGREIVYAAGGSGSQSLWRVPVSGGRAPERLTYAQRAAIQPAIAGSPPRLVYSWNLVNNNLWRLDLRTGERKMLITSTYSQGMPQYSPDGRKIAFQSNRSGDYEVWTCDADGSNCLQITSFEGPMSATPRWSPDSRLLSLDSNAEGQPEIFVVAADGGKPRNITHHPADDILSSWSHDGLWIYFSSDRSGRYELWRIAKDGGEPVQVTRSGGYRTFESPDGKYIYYTKFSQRGLFRMPAQGGEETQILEGPVGTFGVTSKGIYFLPDAKTVQFLDTATGKISTIAALDKPVSGGMCVSPDDAYVVWSQTERASQDLMLVEGFR